MKKILSIYFFFIFNQFLYAQCQYIHRFEFYVGSQVQYCSPNPVFGHYVDGGKGFYCRKDMHSDNCKNNQDGFHDSDYFDNALITSDGVFPNPDPLGGEKCRDLFQKDGVAYTCNPNTNEALPIENSDGVMMDDEGNDKPNCNDGYESSSTMVVNGNGNGYTSWGCSKSSIPENGGDGGDEGTTPTVPDVPNSGVTTSANGTKSWSVGGTTYELTTDGTLTTTYSDGTTSVKNLGSDYYNSGSSGGSGTSTGGGGPGSNGNTTNETDNPNTNDTPVDDTPAANSCQDSSLTLQEKMLCEMNAGMKKLNSESNTENSLNNLLKDLNNTSNTNATAINTNIKETNKKLDSVKALNENQLGELKNITKELKKLNSETSITTPIEEPTITDANEFINGFDEFINDSKNFEEVKEATSEVTGFLNGKFNEYSNSLKSELLSLFSSFFSISTTGLPPIGLAYNFNAFGHTFTGVFLDSVMFEKLGLDKLATIVIFLFSLMGFIHAFKFLMNSSTPIKDK
jgi:hypothetical protein